MDTPTPTTTPTNLALRHLHSLPTPPAPLWPPLHHPTSRCYRLLSLTPRRFGFRVLAIRSRDFDFIGLKFGDNRRKKRRRRRGEQRWKKRRWLSVEEGVPKEARPGALKQVIDSIWILKVLTSYGWFMPAILISLLVATGPKAFLIAFSLPLGLSLVILAYQKLWEWLDDSPKPRRRCKRRSPSRSRNSVLIEEDEEEDDDLEEEFLQQRRHRRRDYVSWVAGSDGSVHMGNSSGKATATSFGGWDELVTEEEERQTSNASETDMPETPVNQEPKLNRSLEDRELPLLLRLLIALFPFIGSWSDLL